MSLAKRLARSVARLYAYAMAPDDHTEQERREIIDQAGEAIDAANALVWFEQEMKSRDVDLSMGTLGNGEARFFVLCWVGQYEPDDVEVTHDCLIELIQLAKTDGEHQTAAVDEWNQPRKNQGGGEPTP
jgi:hypothetical protein